MTPPVPVIYDDFDLIIRVEKEIAIYEKIVEADATTYPSWNKRDFILRRYKFLGGDKRLSAIMDARSRLESLRSTLHLLRRKNLAWTESEVIEEKENVFDMPGGGTDFVPDSTDVPLRIGQNNLLDMSNFLSRPLALTAISVTPGQHLTYVVDLWDVFTSHPSIRAKLRNFAYLRGNMHARVAISGSPFHYAKVLVSYQPLGGYNVNLDYHESQLAGPNRLQSLTYLSQSANSFIMDVRENAPVDIECSYVNVQPMLRLFNKSPLVLGAADPYSDTVGLGKLYVTSINPIRSASLTPTNVSVFVYAWMTEAEFGAPSGTVIDIQTESADERETGPIEYYATRIANISKVVKTVPVFSPFAAASEMIFSGVASMAAIFGFSVPTMNTEPMRVRPQAYQNGANLIGYDTGKRIVLDPKQELTVDPRACGTEEDELALSALCARHSLIDTFEWSPNDVALGVSIWSAPVNPGIAKRFPSGLQYTVQPTPLKFAATPFLYWHGDITFSFEVVCSAYHRGKLAIYFEPNISQHVVIDNALDLNKQYVQIIDIQETTRVDLTVKWAFPKAWARVIGDAQLGDLGGIGFLGDALFDFANGYIAVVPFTTLQSPDSSSVDVNVYVWSDDILFNQLSGLNLPTTRPATQSSVEIVERPSTESLMSPVIADLNPSTDTHQHLSEVHFGETPLSFRSALKRFVTLYSPSSIAVAGTDGIGDFRYIAPVYPLPAPLYDGITSTAEPNLYNYLRLAYLGVRGGMKHRVSVEGDIDIGPNSRVRVMILSPSVNNARFADFRTTNLSPVILNGCVEFVPVTNGGAEFETPLYTNNLFGISFAADAFDGNNSNIDPLFSRRFKYAMFSSSGTIANMVIHHTAAAAEDFTFMRFSGAPLYLTTL